MYPPEIIDRFFKKVAIIPFHNCWEWLAAKDRDGYGHFSYGGKFYQAHRFSWAIHFGKPNSCILHACDNPGCVNPYHLWEGSHADNMKDKARKKRGKKRLCIVIKHV